MDANLDMMDKDIFKEQFKNLPVDGNGSDFKDLMYAEGEE